MNGGLHGTHSTGSTDNTDSIDSRDTLPCTLPYVGITDIYGTGEGVRCTGSGYLLWYIREGDWGSLRYPEPVHVIWDLRTRINYVTDQKGRALTIV